VKHIKEYSLLVKMQAQDYIQPIEFNQMLEAAQTMSGKHFAVLSCTDRLLHVNDSETNITVIYGPSIALYNLIQESREDEVISMKLFYVDDRCCPCRL
jgi:hypothetical protein